MIYWDIDGTIRNLVGEIWHEEFSDWDQNAPDGRTIWETLKEKPFIYYSAKPFPYIEVAKEYERKNGVIEFVSHQPIIPARYYTSSWLSKYFRSFKLNYVIDPKEKEKFIVDDYIVEDYPFFPDYSHVILINRKYNEKTDAPMRVFNCSQLHFYIDEIEKGRAYG